MADKLNNLLRGMGATLALYPEERDLSVESTAAPSAEEAFAMDAAALRGDFERAFERMASHAEEAKAEQA